MDADPRHRRKAWVYDLQRWLHSVLLCLAALFPMQAQGVYRFKSYGPDQGLGNLATTCLTQDDAGYLWVGTEGGLFRYDGQQFQGFGFAQGLTDQLVTDVQPLPGGLFVQTQGGPFRFDGKQFHRWTLADGVSPKGFACVTRMLPNRVWMGSSTGLSSSEDGGLHFHPVAGFSKGFVTAIWADPKSGALFVVQRQGEPGSRETRISRLKDETWESTELPKDLRKNVFDCIRLDSQGRIWMRGSSRLVMMKAWGAVAEDFTGQLPGKPAQSGDGLSVDLEGRIWAATDSGLACFEKNGPWVLDEPRGLPSPWANATFVDREGSLWVAAEGVHRLQGRFLWTAHTHNQGLPLDAVWNILRSHDGDLWAVTPRGMVRQTEHGWEVIPETRDRSLYTLAEDADHGLWVGGLPVTNHANTLFYRASGQSKFIEIPIPSVGRNTVSSMAADASGGLWIGAMNGGLHRLRKVGKGFVCEAVSLVGGAPTESINHLMVDREGLVWTAGDQGVCLFDGHSWRRFGLREGLKEPNASSLARDPKGNVWVAYWTLHGLTRLSREGGVWRVMEQVDQPAELFQHDIVSMACDLRGVFWFGTTQGIKRWKGDFFERYGRSQGLPGDDCAANSLMLDANGDVWVGTSSGIGQFHRSFYHGLPPVPEARITLVKDGSSRVFGSGENLPIPYRWRSMDFAFASLSFLDEAHLRPQVRLVGFEDAWRGTSAREARYTTLPPGQYRFEVRFGDANGQFGEPAIQAFEILSPWWQKPWFYLLVALIVTAAIFLFIRWRTILLLRRTEALKALVKERTVDLSMANEALHEANIALEEASMMDALTSLRNRRYLGLHMPEEEARVLRVYRNFLAGENSGLPKGEDLVFLLVDLDHFKTVNDTYGHAAGDHVLKEAAEVLRRACRETDTVVRWGGEEFIVVARRTDRTSAESIARKIREAMASYRFDLGGGATLQRTCSVGFAAFPLLPAHPATFHWEDAVEMADQCLYAVKRSGRDGWVGVTCEVMDADMAWAPRLLNDLPGLVAEGKLVLRTSFNGPEALVWRA